MDRPSRAQFDQICRLCLNSWSLVNIFERHPKTQKESLSLLVRETVEMLGLMIEPDDGFPKKICIPCKDFLRQLYKFRNQCQEASDLLAEAFSAPEILQNAPSPSPTEIQQPEPPSKLPSPKPQIQIVPSSELLKQEYINPPPPVPPIISPEPVQHDALTVMLKEPELTLEADSSSSYQPSTSVKLEILQSQESTEYLDIAESYTEEYEYLEAEAETIEEEIVNDDAMQMEMQEECTEDVQQVSLIEEQSIEVYVEDDTDTEDESEDINDGHSQSGLSKHASNKGQMCKICGKYTTCLKYHLMCHTGERPFSCNLCDKKFRTSTKLNIHMNGVHLKVRKYTCEICNKKFLDAGNLRNHKVTHGGERKYTCDFEGCGKTFALQGTLTVHKKSHTQDKQFSCDFCSKNFLYKWLLVKHLRTHTGEKPYECDICHKKFSTTTHMHTHKKTHDPEREKHGKKRKARARKTVLVKQDDSDASELVSEN